METELPSNDQELKFCLYSPDGAYLVTSDIDGCVKTWDAKNKYKFIKSLRGHVSLMRDMAFSPSARYLATVAVEMSLRIWDVENNFSLVCVWYGPVNQLSFISERLIILGEATGNRRMIEFDEFKDLSDVFTAMSELVGKQSNLRTIDAEC